MLDSCTINVVSNRALIAVPDDSYCGPLQLGKLGTTEIVAASSALSLRGQDLIATSRNIAARNAVTLHVRQKHSRLPGDLNLKTDRWPKISLIAIPSVFECEPLP